MLALVIGILCGLAIFISIVGIILLYLTKRKLIKIIEAEQVKFKRDIRNICSSAVGVGQRVTDLESYVEKLALRQDKSISRQPTLSSYSHAMKIIEMGGGVEDVVGACGLTRAESELIITLHDKLHDSKLLQERL